MGERILAKITHSEEWWQTKAPATVIRCTASYVTTGERCRSEAAASLTVCDKHGARLPTVQKAAAVRLGEATNDAARKLVEWMNDPQVDMRERVKIAQDILNRGGLGATSKHLIGVVGEADKFEMLFMDILTSPGMFDAPQPLPAAAPELDTGQEEYERRRAERELYGDIIDAEIVPDHHTRHVDGPLAAPTPKHIRDALAQLL